MAAALLIEEQIERTSRRGAGRDPARARAPRRCETCRAPVLPKRDMGQRFCSHTCAMRGVAKLKRTDLATRFWAKVNKDGPTQPHMSTQCWVWTGYTEDGYGRVLVRGDGKQRSERAHRLAWILEHGPIPEGKHVLHECDYRACVRHLYLGDRFDNMRDMWSRSGRSRLLGEANPFSKFTDAQIAEMRRRRAAGERLKVLVAEFGISYGHLKRIVRGAARGVK